jgi:hypothetical protein
MRGCPFHPPVEMMDTETGPHDLSPLVALDPNSGIYHVHCPVCRCQGPLADTAEQAVDLWNTAYVPKKPEGDCKGATVGREC